ncbi:MAG: metallophosphoesterase [Bacteroidaceae bacterium]|nr:metallophosphoesterase [Bacteroidaceae bacterium]
MMKNSLFPSARRSHLGLRLIVLVALCCMASVEPTLAGNRRSLLRGTPVTYNQVGPRIRLFSKDVKETVKLFVISDTHLWMSDSREDPYRQYSERMASAYHNNRHFQTGEPTTSQESFLRSLDMAKQKGADAIVLMGDIFSYPSEAAIDFAVSRLDSLGIPYYYIFGNHDWHYEGMEGTEIDLRAEWAKRRFGRLFRDRNPLIYSVDVKGLRLIMLDTSVYEILPEQLSIFRQEMKTKVPTLLMCHVPFYAPGFGPSYGVGHPDWNAANDRNYKVERRPQWPAEGHKPEAFALWQEVLKAHRSHRLLASFAGHVHTMTTSVVGPWVQFTTAANLAGGYLEVTVEPIE